MSPPKHEMVGATANLVTASRPLIDRQLANNRLYQRGKMVEHRALPAGRIIEAEHQVLGLQQLGLGRLANDLAGGDQAFHHRL